MTDVEEHHLIESLAETIQEEIGEIGWTEIVGSAINLFRLWKPHIDHLSRRKPFSSDEIPLWQYVATVGIHNQRIILAVRNATTNVSADISDPESFDLVFSKIRELCKENN